MSATYNWAYKPGVTNKYGITIASSADNIRPSNACYVALFGNDTTGNGSRQLPWRTLQKVVTVLGGTTTFVIIGSGSYREQITSGNISQLSLVGDGDVTIDSSYYGNFIAGSTTGGLNGWYNIQLIGSGNSLATTSSFAVKDCIINGSYFTVNDSNIKVGNIYKNITQTFHLFKDPTGSNFYAQNCTFYNCQAVQIWNDGGYAAGCVFVKCNITAMTMAFMSKMQYCLFYQCNFKITTGWVTDGVNLYGTHPTVPTGFTNFTTIAALKAALITYDPTIINPLVGCTIADPKFNNEAIGDLTLAFDSPAKNLSYFGTYVGARSVAYPIKAKANESAGDFDFSSATNLTIADDSITFTNSALDAQIDTNVIGNLLGRELAKIPSYGFNADRNGQYIDSIADLAGSTIAAGDTLSVLVPYLVETGAITYNSNIYQPGDRFTTVTGVTTFTTGSGGVVREILEAPQRHTIMARFGDGGSAVTAGTALTVGYWYSVLAGSVTYDSMTYNAPAFFKAVDTNAFSGSGTVELAMSTESYQHYEPYVRPLSNNIGDARTGAIVRGNGDPDYVRGGVGVKEFPINAKYMQFRYYLKASNLKP